MTRLLSGVVLIVFAIGVVWFAPASGFLIVAELLLVLAVSEYRTLARASGLDVPIGAAGAAAMLTCAAFARVPSTGIGSAPVDVVLLTALVALGGLSLSRWRGGNDALANAAASLFPALYLGLPLGAMIAIREGHGREALLLMMVTVSVSDTAQYYSGRAFGRRPLAPVISPKKTIEGAIGGFVCGSLFLAVAGHWWLPVVPLGARLLLGAGMVIAGIAGDLFESMLKRSAGIKDSSSLIPGHGGVLDRIDAMLFVAPLYYVVLKYA